MISLSKNKLNIILTKKKKEIKTVMKLEDLEPLEGRSKILTINDNKGEFIYFVSFQDPAQQTRFCTLIKLQRDNRSEFKIIIKQMRETVLNSPIFIPVTKKDSQSIASKAYLDIQKNSVQVKKNNLTTSKNIQIENVSKDMVQLAKPENQGLILRQLHKDPNNQNLQLYLNQNIKIERNNQAGSDEGINNYNDLIDHKKNNEENIGNYDDPSNKKDSMSNYDDPSNKEDSMSNYDDPSNKEYSMSNYDDPSNKEEGLNNYDDPNNSQLIHNFIKRKKERNNVFGSSPPPLSPSNSSLLKISQRLEKTINSSLSLGLSLFEDEKNSLNKSTKEKKMEKEEEKGGYYENDYDNEESYNQYLEKQKSSSTSKNQFSSFNFNQQFQTALESVKSFDEIESLEKIAAHKKFMSIIMDFIECATKYGKIIISELFIPNEQKTIKPDQNLVNQKKKKKKKN